MTMITRTFISNTRNIIAKKQNQKIKPKRCRCRSSRFLFSISHNQLHFALVSCIVILLSVISAATPAMEAASTTQSVFTAPAAVVQPHTAALSAPVGATSILEQFSPNCSAVTHIFVAKGIVEIPQKPSNDMVLRYCESPSVGTCCTYNMETKLAMQSRLQLEKQSKEQIQKLSTMLSTKAHKFNELFQNMLIESKKEFHNMFTRTYGVIYQQNSLIFSDLFNELENYYARGRVDLLVVMDKFFNRLYQRMFQVLNAQFTFDEKYLVCVSEHMKELKPFGDVPDKLSVQIKRSFVATRTYGHALAVAGEITKKLVNIRLNADCTAALTKMQHCGACKGYTEKPCTNYCVNVIKGCLHYFNELDTEWDNFASAMDKVADRLLGSFNIVMVVEPINIKISEAIMNFQDAGRDITNRVFQGCGRPALGRQKRALSPKHFAAFQSQSDSKVIMKRSLVQAHLDQLEGDILDIDATLDEEIVLREKRAAEPGSREGGNKFNEEQSFESRGSVSQGTIQGGGGGGGAGRRNRKKQQQQNRKNDDNDYSGRDPILDKVVRDIRQRIKESKKFWSNLPHQICSNEEIAVSSDADNMCWNGHTIDRYMHSVTTEQGRNPEFPGNPATARQTAIVTSQLFYLKSAINHLRNAHNGQDVDWSDEEEPYYGSGSGSGGGVDDEDDDEEGSGLGGGSPFTPHHKPGLEDTERPSVRVDDEDEDDEDRNTISTHTSRPKVVSGGSGTSTIHEQETNELDEGADHDESKGGSGSSKTATMSLRRALLVYLLPLYMTWFGGICADFL